MYISKKSAEDYPGKFARDSVIAILLFISMISTTLFLNKHNIDVIRTIVGPFFGFVGALFIYVIGLLIEDIEKYRSEKRNTKFVFELYKIEINKNIGHIQHMIDKKWVPYYRLKTITRDNLWGALADYSKDLIFMGKLNDIYGEYELINNKTDIMNSVRLAKLSATSKEIDGRLAEEINNQLSGCIGLGKNAIKMSSECIKIIEDKIIEVDKPISFELFFYSKKKIVAIIEWLGMPCRSIHNKILGRRDAVDKSCKRRVDWRAISAIGTILAVVWAIYHQEIRDIIYRPVFELTFFEKTTPHLMEQIGASIEKTDFKEYTGLFVTFQLINKGKAIARDVEPLLTAIGYKNNKGVWERENNWVALPLTWVLGEPRLRRDLVPLRPYMFNLGSFSSARDGRFLFTYIMSPKAQKETVGPGDYCFEITIFSVNAKTQKKYIYLKFDEFSWENGVDLIKKKIDIEMKNYSPWGKNEN